MVAAKHVNPLRGGRPERNVPDCAVRAGAPAPLFALPDPSGVLVSLGALLRSGPVAISFHEGEWCPFRGIDGGCEDNLGREVELLEATLVSISARIPAATGSGCRRLLDAGDKVAGAFGLADSPAIGKPEKIARAPKPRQSPIAATYVLDRSGEIVFSCIDCDPTNPIDPKDVLTVLRCLRDREAYRVQATPQPPRMPS